MERLGASMFDLGLPAPLRHRLLCDTAATMWRPAPDVDLPTGADHAAWLVDHIITTWERPDRPCSLRAVDHAVACAERRRRGHDDERAVLVHGDVHQWNALRTGIGPEAAVALVDHDGYRAEAEYDLGSSCVRTRSSSWPTGIPSPEPASWPDGPGSASTPSQSGARSSGWPPVCSPPPSTSDPSVARCSPPPTRWPRRGVPVGREAAAQGPPPQMSAGSYWSVRRAAPVPWSMLRLTPLT